MIEGTSASIGAREQAATRIIFFVMGVCMAAWAPLVPLAKSRLALDEAGLGVLLLCLGFGSVVGMPLSGGLAARFGCRRTILTASLVAGLALPFLTVAATPLHLGIALAIFGAGLGVIDVVMNLQAIIVERAGKRAMMSGFHGMFSVGGLIGASGMTGLLSLGVPSLPAVGGLVALCAILLAVYASGLLPYGSEEETKVFALPKGRVLLIGTLCFALFLAEGSVLDWSGVLLHEIRGVPESQAGLGYVAFALAMTIFRLAGDAIVARLGSARTLILGSLCAAGGFLLSSLVPNSIAALAGYVLVGMGAANAVPVLFSAAGNQRVMPTNLAVAAVTTMGYAGILLGPALIGFVARGTSLPLALLMVAAALIGVAIAGKAATAE